MAPPATVHSPLGDDIFFLRQLTGDEQLSRPFHYELVLHSTRFDIDAADLLGLPLTVAITSDQGTTRYYNGLVTKFQYLEPEGRYSRYGATLQPWLAVLQHTTQSRIFQNETVPDILKSVFKAHGFSDFEFDLTTEQYLPREYCVQYRESDFNFVSRLLEHEGIHYYAEHSQSRHTLVFADANHIPERTAGHEELPYRVPTADAVSPGASFTSWAVTDKVLSGTYKLRSYDYLKPKADLDVVARSAGAYSQDEVYDFPGDYVDVPTGERYAQRRLQALHVEQTLRTAEHTAVGLTTGSSVQLSRHPRAAENTEYRVLAQRFTLSYSAYESGGGDSGFEAHATLLNSGTPFVPPRTTPVPLVHGPQTATVAGEPGNEPWTDSYGRVKLLLHWDREGTGDAQSSCWVRISQNSASNGWGAMFLPHVGDEVIVSFLDGDPDRPIVTGRVYNDIRKPPLKLPDTRNTSIIRDHSGNQLVFEATPKQEYISIFCPTADAGLKIDKHKYRQFTPGKHTTFTLKSCYAFTVGNGYAFTLGSATAVTRGFWCNYKAGIGLDVTIGAAATLSAGAKLTGSAGINYDFSMQSKFTWAKDKTWLTSSGSAYTRSKDDIVIDSDARLTIAGGAEDQAMVVADKDALELSYKAQKPGRNVSALDKWMMGVGLAGSGIVASVSALLATANHLEANELMKLRQRPDADFGTTPAIDNALDDMCGVMTEDVVAVGAAAFGTLTALLGAKPKTVEKPHSEGAPTGIRFTSDKSYLWAKGAEAKTFLELENAGNIALSADQAMKLIANSGDVTITGKNKVEITCDAHIKGTLHHRNLKAE